MCLVVDREIICNYSMFPLSQTISTKKNVLLYFPRDYGNLGVGDWIPASAFEDLNLENSVEKT